MNQGIKNKKALLFVGTYTENLGFVDGQAKGIGVFQMNLETGELSFLLENQDIPNPSFLVIHPSGRYLYAVHEMSQFQGQPGGGVSAYKVDSGSGRLTLLNQQLSHGVAPCHVSLDVTSNYIFVANYSSGNVAMYPLLGDGSLGEACAIVQHHSSGSDPFQRGGPHAHAAYTDPRNHFVLVLDLGIDQVVVYRLDLEQGTLTPNDPPFVGVKPGAGPRHLAFHPSGRYVFVINELNASMTVFSYDSLNGVLKEIQTIGTLPSGYSGKNACAEVAITSDGRFIYGSNRFNDTIVIFAVDPASGRLSLVDHTPTQGKTPRSFAIDPTGRFLLVANQDSNTIVLFTIDPQTGKLTPSGQVIPTPTPVCLTFLQI